MDLSTLPPWLQALLQRESGGNWGIVNSGGYSGGFQFGEGAARDSGTYSGDANLTDNRFGGTFRGPNGETLSFDQWLASPEAQLATMNGWTQHLDQQIRGQGLDRYVGQTIGGVPVTMEGLYTGAHLGGIGGLSSWLRGTGNPADGNGTRVGDYVAMGSGAGTRPGGMGQRDEITQQLASLAPAAGGQSMAGGGLLGVQPPALRQSWLGGLLGVEPSADQGILGSFLNPQGSADRLGLLGLAANLLQASGPSTDPSHGSFGSALGAGLQGYVAGSETGAKRDERDRRKAAIDAMLSGAGGNPQIAALAAAFPEQYGAAMLQQAFQGPGKPIVTDGGLVLSPDGTSMIADYRQGDAPPAPPALIQSLQMAGIDPQSEQGRQIIMANLGGSGGSPPSSVQEYEYARQQGFQGSFQDWQAQGRSQGAAPPASIQEYQLTQQQGFTGTFADWQAQQAEPPDTFKDEASLRGEFTKASAPYVAIRDAYNRLTAAAGDGTGASDIAMVYSFMKMLDPTSVVREGEYATAEQAGGIPASVLNVYNRLVNGERLPQSLRDQFLSQGAAQYQAAESSQTALVQQYQGLAQHYNFDPAGIALDMSAGTHVRQPPAAGGTMPVSAPGAPALNLTGLDDAAADRAYESMPSGTVYIGPDGNQYRKP